MWNTQRGAESFERLKHFHISRQRMLNVCMRVCETVSH